VRRQQINGSRLDSEGDKPPVRLVFAIAGLSLALYAGGRLLFGPAACASAPTSFLTADDICLAANAIEKDNGTRDGAWRAAALFSGIVQREPASAYQWSYLGDSLAHAGDLVRAEHCFLRAVQLSPKSAQTLLNIADFYYNSSQQNKALPYFSRILDLTETYDSRVYRYYDSIEHDFADVVSLGFPGRRAANTYFRKLLLQHQRAKADQLWNWMSQHSFADAASAAPYSQALFEDHMPKQAAEVWGPFTSACSPGYPAATRIYDGEFECKPAGSAFDWRIGGKEGAVINIDRTVKHGGQASLRIRFDGTRNPDFHEVTQNVYLQPGTYELTAWVRTGKLSTDEGIGFRIVDPESPKRLDVSAGNVTGSVEWTPVQAQFAVTPATPLLMVQIVRRPSLKIDNQISGTAWIDSVAIHPK
jgi:tetratricopeptide (TPR) repeat protein